MKTLRKLLPFLSPYRGRILAAILGTCIVTGLTLMPPLVMKAILDRAVIPQAWHRLLPLVALYACLPIAAHTLNFFRLLLVVTFGRRVMDDIRMAMYRHLLRLAMRYHGDHSAGSIIQRLITDNNEVLKLLTGQTIQLITDLGIFIFSTAVCLWLSPLLCGVLFFILCLYVGVYHYYARRIKKATHRYRSITDTIAGRLQETVSGVRQVRIYNREEEEMALFMQQTHTGLDRVVDSGMSTTSMGTVCTAISNFGSHTITCIGSYLVLTHRISFGDLVAVGAYVASALQPALRLTNIAGQMAEVGVSLRRMFEVLDEDPDLDDPVGAPDIAPGPGRVEFDNIHFAYTPDKPLYRELDLTVESGQTIALVGHTGCGKTSLTALLMRYWDPQKGCVRIDGTDIKTVRLKSLRNRFGVVLQEPVVFEGTLGENIAYGVPRAPRERIEEAAHTAELGDLIERLPDGLDTQLGTYGVKLSVGEKQRVSIARAVLKDPPILVMDEATSSLDSESEALIQKALGRLLQGRTSFVVAHRLSTITGADRIVVMDDGAIVESGTHTELMDIEGGAYRHLYEELRKSGQEGTA
ncbi:MAG: ABC transporter ATP-binding protein [Planctomycetota bacterium]